MAATLHYALRVVHAVGTLPARILDAFSDRKPEPADPRRILLVRADGIGDVVLTIPAFRGIRERFPEAKITLIAAPPSRPVVAPMPWFDEIRYVDFPWMRAGASWRVVPRAIHEVRRARFDLAVDFRGDARVILFIYLCGIPRRVGLAASGCDFLLTDAVDPPEDSHMLDWSLALLERLGAGVPRTDLELPLAEEDRGFAATVWREEGLEGAWPVVSIHPDVRWYGRKWDNDRYAAIADRLVERYGARIVLTGAPSEAPCAEDVAARMRHTCVMLAGRTTVGQLAAVLARSDLFLGADSGPAHLAAASGTPVVALFGPNDPVYFGPYGDAHRVVTRRQHFPCSPCAQDVCVFGRAESCMGSLGVDEVWLAVDEQMASLAAKRAGR
jgi:lipopolysaccharide heptosyltransferase II